MSQQKEFDIAKNKKARFQYDIIETFEAGIVLKGTEVKSIRNGKVNISESYGRIRDGEVYIMQMNISPYEQGNRFNHDPAQPRKLLLHKREISKLYGKIMEKGLTLVPLKLYFKNGKAKIELALAKGKTLYDKRHSIKQKQDKREMERAIKEKNR
ncbi:MAG: SsrA-binding protein SmpB [Spirochaetes bacterium]|nr:SsrA-binding protein SmpB [Spirochaetota bacterium]MBN2771178.1 SsrA-binding protein SmpB [Spirochaetota bacterium]HRX14904.1 SsrA-binding protein SmpB [Spirochaetota bacterium]